MESVTCRFCGARLEDVVVDLGMSPLCESFLPAAQLDRMEPFYPLKVWVCKSCFLVQLSEYVRVEEIFTEYAYFSSFSSAWLKHAEEYVAMVTKRLSLTKESFVVELASNDGYLLQYFVKTGIPCLGVEPAANVAKAAEERGVKTQVAFFNVDTAKEMKAAGKMADLVLGNNVLAQVPDLNSFVGGLPIILKPKGTVTFEFPHLMQLFENNQFDTIYHEHFSYFSLIAVEAIFARHGLTIFDVEELWTHGGSLRIFARHAADDSRPVTERLLALRAREEEKGYRKIETYTRFEERVRETKRKILEVLIDAKRRGKRIVGYGAPGKGNTLLNYCSIRTDFIDFTVDRNPYKHGRFLPGTHIPIFPPEHLDQAKPDYVFILPWNLKDEIMAQLSHVRGWGGRFIVPIPEPTVV
ncbi:MAG TPA: class I SAM-dependent methyltransferase [Polyangiaceae bacterium]|nr:class I SAM-dependent methyltransferase [Polyangiaceae bacterium]